jgi:hypothetical protein
MPPLEPQIVEVRLGKADTEGSDKLAVAGTLTVAQNAEVSKTGRYQRRPGTLYFDTLAGASRIHAGERELLVGTSAALYSDIDAVLTNRGAIAGFRSDWTPINNSTFAQQGHDFIRFAGYDWHVWSEAGGIFYCVRDSETGAYIVVDGLVEATSAAGLVSPRIVQGGPTTLLITYVLDNDSNDPGGAGQGSLLCRKISIATPTVVSAASAVIPLWGAAGSAGTWGSYDVVYKSGTTVCLAYVLADTQLWLNEWNVATMASVVTLGSPLTLGTGFIAGSPGARKPFIVSFFKGDQSAGYTLAFAHAWTPSGTSTASYIRKVTAAAGLGGSQTHVDVYNGTTTTNEEFDQVTGEIDSAGDTQIMASMLSSAASTRAQLWRVKRTAAGVNSGPFIRYGFRLMSKMFTYNGQDLVLASAGVTLSTAQEDRTLYIIEIISGAIVGRALPSLAGLAPTDARTSMGTRGVLPVVAVVAATVTDPSYLLFPTIFFQTPTVHSASLVRLDTPLPARWLEVAGTTLVPGATISIYDGAGLSELGFYHPPSQTVAAVVGAILPNGNYYYRGTWAWTDAQGRLHRSDASEALLVTTTGGNTHPRVTVQTLNATLKSAPVQGAVFELWRTTINPSAAGAAAFFLIVQVDNVPTSDTIVIDDSTADTVIIIKERLYTLGNAVLGNTTPPPANMLATWGNRVWAAERDVLWYSKELVDGYGVAFSDEQYLQVSDDRGDITAIADAGQKLLVCKRSALYVVSGDGPDATGKGSFSPLRRLPAPLGARSAVAVVSTELGVFFQDDASGQIWLVPPEGDATFIGKEVSALAPLLTVTDMTVVPGKRQVRIFSREGTTLVYDMSHLLWTWSTDQPATAAAVVDDVSGYVTPTGEIRFDDEDTFSEGAVLAATGTVYRMVLETAWIPTNQIGGFQRCYAVVAVGLELGEHLLTVTLGFQFGVVEQENTLDSSVIDDTFGYRVVARPHIRQQRATAIKARYEDDAPVTPGFALEALNLTVGIRPTRERTPRAHIATIVT